MFIKPFTFKVLPHETGKANKKTIGVIKDKIKELFNENYINLQNKAVDGDPGYNTEFELEFKVLFKHFPKHGIEGLSDLIDNLKEKYANNKSCLILTDMVHFLKNRRTEIIINNVILKGNIILVECFEEILCKSASFFDKSSLSKLQDQFPIEIFNFQIFSIVLKCRNDDSQLLP